MEDNQTTQTVDKLISLILANKIYELKEHLYLIKKYRSEDEKIKLFHLSANIEAINTSDYLHYEKSIANKDHLDLKHTKILNEKCLKMEAASYLVTCISAWFNDHSLRGQIRSISIASKDDLGQTISTSGEPQHLDS